MSDQAQYQHILEITEEPIELYKILKIENLVSGGGEAKMLIAEGYVLLNGEVETRKRKKVVDGDVVEFNGEQVLVKLVDPASPAGQAIEQSKPAKKKARKAISFG